MSDNHMKWLDALDFGQAFLVMKFSQGTEQSDKISDYAQKLGIPLALFSEVPPGSSDTHLLEVINQQLERTKPALHYWFEIGWKYVFISNMCKFPPADATLDDALSGFRGALELGGVEIADRDELQSQLLTLKDVADVDAAKMLERGLEKLRSIAKSLDESDAEKEPLSKSGDASFFKRDWTDAERWGMGIVAALVVAGFLAVFSFRTTSNQTDLALLAGYDAAFALAMNNQGDDITAIRSEIDARLRLLGMDDLRYPQEPGNGEPVANFANQVIGFLSARSAEETCAFQLGFAGLVETNTPGTYSGFSIEETAVCAGFPEMPNLNSEEYLTRLVEIAQP